MPLYIIVTNIELLQYHRTTHDDVIKWKHFHVASPLWGESTGHGWIPLTEATYAELWCFLWYAPDCDKRLSKQSRRQWFGTPSRSLWRHGNVTRNTWDHIWMFVLSGEMKMLPLQDCAWGFGLYLSIISLVQWGHSNPRWRMVNRAPGIRPRHPYTYTECTVTHWGLVTQICIYEVTLHLCRKRRGASSAQSHYLNKCWHIASWAVRVISDSTLQWRHNDCDGVSNHLRFDCLFNRLFKRGSKKYYTPASLAFVIWIHRWPGWPVESPHKGPVTRTMFPFDAVFMKYTHFCSIKYIWKMSPPKHGPGPFG